MQGEDKKGVKSAERTPTQSRMSRKINKIFTSATRISSSRVSGLNTSSTWRRSEDDTEYSETSNTGFSSGIGYNENKTLSDCPTNCPKESTLWNRILMAAVTSEVPGLQIISEEEMLRERLIGSGESAFSPSLSLSLSLSLSPCQSLY